MNKRDFFVGDGRKIELILLLVAKLDGQCLAAFRLDDLDDAKGLVARTRTGGVGLRDDKRCVHGLSTFVVSRQGTAWGDARGIRASSLSAANFLLGLPDREGFLGNFEFELETLVKRGTALKMLKSAVYSDGYEFAPKPEADSAGRFSKINTNRAAWLVLSKYCAERRNTCALLYAA
ncbi:MAG TPA: hypothetical protein VNK48_02010 [Xanthobacteraceae bacterium]|nr:hypothetical protein [Xanthobacteraceae bacterium]